MSAVTWRHQNKVGGGVQEANICEPQAPPPVGPKQAQGAFQTSFGSFKRSTDHIEGFPSKGLWSRRWILPLALSWWGGVRQSWYQALLGRSWKNVFVYQSLELPAPDCSLHCSPTSSVYGFLSPASQSGPLDGSQACIGAGSRPPPASCLKAPQGPFWRLCS